MKCLVTFSLLLLATLTSAQTADNFANVAIIFANRTSEARVLLSAIGTSSPPSNLYNPNLKTILWFFGFRCNKDTSNHIRTGFENLGGYNYIIVDWSSYNQGTYIQAVNSINPIAKKVAAVLNQALNSTSIKNWHFIGESLGAHLAGHTARELKALSNALVVPRLSGLDPAGVIIFPPTINTTLIGNFEGLKKTDAAFVDAIHTDARFAGTRQSVGTVDFYVNDAANPQPGCPPYIAITNETFFAGLTNVVVIPHTNWDSHVRVSRLFAESINNPNAFAAKKCLVAPNIAESVTCSSLEATASGKMGFYAAETLSGSYFLETNGAAPFSK